MKKLKLSVFVILILGVFASVAKADNLIGSEVDAYLNLNANQLSALNMDSNALYELFVKQNNLNFMIKKPTLSRGLRQIPSGQTISGRDLKCFFLQVAELKKVNWDRYHISQPTAAAATITLLLESYVVAGQAKASTAMAYHSRVGFLDSFILNIQVDDQSCKVIERAELERALNE